MSCAGSARYGPLTKLQFPVSRQFPIQTHLLAAMDSPKASPDFCLMLMPKPLWRSAPQQNYRQTTTGRIFLLPRFLPSFYNRCPGIARFSLRRFGSFHAYPASFAEGRKSLRKSAPASTLKTHLPVVTSPVVLTSSSKSCRFPVFMEVSYSVNLEVGRTIGFPVSETSLCKKFRDFVIRFGS